MRIATFGSRDSEPKAAKHKWIDTHVDTAADPSRDGGSIPPASTNSSSSFFFMTPPGVSCLTRWNNGQNCVNANGGANASSRS